ncbi:MAG: GNAT family N-acetyltransferase [Methanotrichaceae archaeon]|nr:GNAT family N-acetyltransferase [Methanotrichaceae archaeon]
MRQKKPFQGDLPLRSEGGVRIRPVLVRRLQPDDLMQALEIDREVFGGYDLPIFTAFYEYHPATTLVAEVNGIVAGLVLGFKPTPLEGRIFWLAVRPSFQSQGIGARLLIDLLRIFRKMGALSATLEVRISNKKAQNLYCSLGFQAMSVHPAYYSNGETALIMRRWI